MRSPNTVRSVPKHTMVMMQAAVRLYERCGFVRAPELDFCPAQGILVKGYCCRLDGRMRDLC